MKTYSRDMTSNFDLIPGDTVVWSTSPPGTFGQQTMRLRAVVLKVKRRVQIRLESGEVLWVSADKISKE